MTSKAERIVEECILQQPVDLEALRALSRQPGGFQSNKLRVRVWPKLLDINRYNLDDFAQDIDLHRDDSQVKCDVERSLWNIEVVKNWRDSYRDRRRRALSDIIMSILCRNKGLYYYQGFHDLVSVFLLVFQDDHLAFAAAERVAQSFMPDFMQENFDVICKFMKIMLVIIKIEDRQLHKHFVAARMEPFFATSWLLTWFSHDIKKMDIVARIFDVLLCSPPIYSFYLCAAYVIHLRKEILDVEADFATLHNVLARAPEKFGFPADELVLAADKLMEEIPLTKIMRHCDPALLQLINSNQISVASKTYFQIKTVDSDWTLLEQLRLVPQRQFPVANKVMRVLWCHGWNMSFLSVTPRSYRTIPTQQTAITSSSSGSSNLNKDSDTNSSNSPKSYGGDNQDDEAKSATTVLLDMLDNFVYNTFVHLQRVRNQYAHPRSLPTLLRTSLFWSITVAVSGIVGYAYFAGDRNSGEPNQIL